MGSFQTLKDIRYWLLFVPTMSVILYIAIIQPVILKDNPYLYPIVLILIASLFWIVYYGWKFYDGKKKHQ